MATYNFGMLTAGMPDPTMRQASTGIQDAGYYQGLYDDFLKGWQTRYDAAAPRWVDTTPAIDYSSVFNAVDPVADRMQAADPGRFGANYDPGANNAWNMQQVQGAFGGNTEFQNNINNHLAAAGLGPVSFAAPSPSGYYDDSARQALNAEKAKQDATLGAQASSLAANQQAQQQAYNTSGGGTFLGGNINASYATPQTGLDPNSSLNGMLTQQPWSMPGFGGPTGGASQSGFGTNTGNAWGGSQPSGWGGPFTAKNPWAAS